MKVIAFLSGNRYTLNTNGGYGGVRNEKSALLVFRIFNKGYTMTRLSIALIICVIFIQHLCLGQQQMRGEGEPVVHSSTLFTQSREFIEREEYDSAAHYLELCITLLDTEESVDGSADSVFITAGNVYHQLGERERGNRDFQKAGMYHARALELRDRVLSAADPALADSYYYLGLIDFILGHFHEGMQRVYRSLDIRTETYGMDHIETSHSYNLLGSYYSIMNHYEEAERYYSTALEIRSSVLGETHSTVAASYNNLGIVSRQRGDFDSAIAYYTKAISIRRAIEGGEHPLISDNYENLATVYAAKNDYATALEYYNRALEIRLNAFGEDDISVARTLNNIGATYRDMGDYRNALEYLERARTLRQRVVGEKHPDFAQSLNNIGVVHSLTEEYDLALEYLHRAISIRRDVFGEHNTALADSYHYVADVHRLRGEEETAVIYYEQAIAALVPGYPGLDALDDNLSVFTTATLNFSLFKALHDQAETYRTLYEKKEHDYSYLIRSLPLYRATSHIIDLMRTSYGAEQSKLYLSEFSTDFFERAIEVHLTLHSVTGNTEYAEGAYIYAEQSRSTILWNAMSDARARHFAGIPDTLLERERQLHQSVIQSRMQLQRVRTDSEDFQRYRNNYFADWHRYNRFIEELEQQYPRYHALKYAEKTSTVAEVQEVLPNDTAVLHYSIGETGGYLFVITRSGFDYVALPPRHEIDNHANTLIRSLRRIETTDFFEPSHKLYALLIEPAAALIADKQNLIIIPDGILNYIPFEALITARYDGSAPGQDFSSLPYLLNTYTISYQYAGKLLLGSLRERRETRAHMRFTGFAPVFSPQQGTVRSDNDDETGIVHRFRSYLIDEDWLTELTHSEDELRTIVQMFQDASLPAVGYTYADASKENFLRHAGKASIIHVASHSFFNETEPDLSGILFTTGDTKGPNNEYTVLYAGEMYGIGLEADLIVLSSCESGLGTLVRGEGMMSITRGLLYAGAQNVVVSLWKVGDLHTRDLMIDFYRAVLQGQPYAAALRTAKLLMVDNEQSAFPAFWSGFIHIGM
jgi:CHAT domain-containing protein/Tfp pilus assembly protein PilF